MAKKKKKEAEPRPVRLGAKEYDLAEFERFLKLVQTTTPNTWGEQKHIGGAAVSREFMAHWFNVSPRNFYRWLARGRRAVEQTERETPQSVLADDRGYVLLYQAVAWHEEMARHSLLFDVAAKKDARLSMKLLERMDRDHDPIRKAKIVEARTNAKIARLKAKILEKVDGLIDRGEMQEALALLQMQPKQIEKTAAE